MGWLVCYFSSMRTMHWIEWSEAKFTRCQKAVPIKEFYLIQLIVSSNFWNVEPHLLIPVKMHSYISILSEWLHDLFSTPQRFWGLVTYRVCSFLRSTYRGKELFKSRWKIRIIPSWWFKGRSSCLEMSFCCGPELNDGKFWYDIQMVVVSIIPKIYFKKLKGSKLTPIRGDHFWQSLSATTRGLKAIGGAISLKHCVAGPRAAWFWEVELPKRWRCWT